MAKTKLPTQSYRGARDFYPEDMQIQNFIFDTWIKVCKRYGFERYDFPILEPFEIFAAKTGEEIVNEQLFWFEDRSGRKIAVRPELTPGTVRLIAQRYNELPKPIKWFMIGNNWRYEKPQVGRGREFNQLEANIFGEPGVNADFEIFALIIDIMKAFGADSEQFELRFSDRKLLNALLLDTLKLDPETAVKTRRLMDKFAKMNAESFEGALSEVGLDKKQINSVIAFLTSDFEGLRNIINKDFFSSEGFTGLNELVNLLEKTGLILYCRFDPTIIRGFDYSDGLVYEVYDKNPSNRRSLFGGERFDKLVEIFGEFELAATGFAMGDWTLAEFLKNWNLLPAFQPTAEYLVTTWPSEDKKYFYETLSITQELRKRNKNVLTWLDTNSKLEKQLKYANKKQIPFVIIIGESELAKKEITIKDLQAQTQKTVSKEEFFKSL